MQLIKRAEENAAELYENIKDDNRNHDATQPHEKRVAHRNFEQWIMSYKNLATLNSMAQQLSFMLMNC